MRDDTFDRYLRALAPCMAGVILALKAYAVAPYSPVGAALSTLVEAALLGLLWWGGSALAARFSRARLVPLALSVALAEITLLIVSCHAFFFASASERKLSVLELDLGALAYFFVNVLPATGYAVLLGVLVVSHGAAGVLVRRELVPPHAPLKRAVGLAALLGVAAPFTTSVPSPLVDTVLALHQAITTPKLTLLGTRSTAADLAALDRSRGAPTALATRYKKVLVFVMETMTVEQLERERKALPADTFVNAAPARAHHYTRYFPGNQDSRTGMLGMLSSRFIPYEAYTEEGRDRYMFLKDRPSLVQHMRRLGYETAFVVSQQELELVVTDLPWQRLVHLDESKVAKARDAGLLCFVPYEFEHSCEDRALLPELLSLIDESDRLFLYHEFVWGHAAEYNEASGRTNTDYYSRFIDAVVRHLRERDLLDDTLIVLTADHGFRGTDEQRTLGAYHIPLLFHAHDFEKRTDDRLFSHVDFADLLFHELSQGSPAPAERPFTLVMGPTKSSFFMALTRDREFMLFKSREGEHWLLEHDLLDGGGRAVRALEERATPARMLRLFFDYRAAFDRSAQDAPAAPSAQGSR